MLKKIVISLIVIGSFGMLSVGACNLKIYLETNDKIFENVQTAREQQLNGKLTKKPQAIIIFGAGVWGNRPSPMLEDRLKKGLEAYRKGMASKILVTGDHMRKGYNEVQLMKDYLKQKGVRSGDIFMDHAGSGSYESMARASNVFGVTSAVLISQQYHLPRCLYLADAWGIDAIGIPAKKIHYGGQFLRDVREYLARTKDVFAATTKLKGYLKGDKIDITGDGDVTNDVARNTSGLSGGKCDEK